ncbi:MAG TPA: hypothetical protein PLP91_05840 [Plasticicumulans sp.]|nr:hypothetical protein [Plasticicumulans sp.]HMV37866.1 hypothetical protein [Plasticicumulans sp.]HMW28490.1 hypothetical protein [Plasticicumulans sp.]HMW40961.1 hypothetical protein [Plasticicumulans sp.]HMZ09476.1 hypothetical protein [Plasticicumulans sp.]HNB89889.1 hypothetical protein [Plasticicumulans sp.]
MPVPTFQVPHPAPGRGAQAAAQGMNAQTPAYLQQQKPVDPQLLAAARAALAQLDAALHAARPEAVKALKDADRRHVVEALNAAAAEVTARLGALPAATRRTLVRDSAAHSPRLAAWFAKHGYDD